ncbi:SHOCT domain-containing protein [Halomarina litorea]|uniref:SHOCT domain-containing protein n=1 Tax=Halomarina litorea TaxID=2961595 RepID=UPI0020C4233B|nr:SHOCT domain-containing protein [Halomarina sp. BCD28]
MLVLGLGFVALFSGFEYFFLVWILGFTVVVPIVAMLFEDEEREAEKRDAFFEEIYRGAERLASGIRALETGTAEPVRSDRRDRRSDPDPVPRADALATLRDRYARGELTDEQFERKLDRLLETDTPENAADWRREERERRREREHEFER